MRKNQGAKASRKGFRLFIAVASIALLGAAPQAAFAVSQKGALAEHVPGEYVVKFKAGRVSAKAALQRSLGRLGTASVTSLKTDSRFATVRVRTKASTQEVLNTLSRNPAVEYAEPNFIYRTQGNVEARDGWGGWPGFPGWGGDWGGGWNGGTGVVPNDAQFSGLWGLMNTGQADSAGQVGTAGVDIDATLAWSHGTGSRSVVVAVIDTGIDYTHEDLQGNIWVNPGEIAGNGIDDDGNGFIDDVRGWNFAGDNNDPMDDNRHGTHCAGTIGARGNNGIGVAGVNWEVTLMPIKFLTGSGSGSLADALESIKYATKMRVNVMSNSWGGGGYSRAMEDAIKEARDAGILFVAAAGNETNNNDARPTYPATYQVENVVSVSATDNQDRLANFSNWGATKVHLAAPGVKILSSTPGNGYESFSGTSMACPHVAGAAALVWSLNPTMGYAEIKDRLMSTVDPVRTLRNRNIVGGRLNVFNAVTGHVPERVVVPEEGWMAMAYHIESEHDYADNSDLRWEVKVPGARYIRIRFSRVQVEEGYDMVRILDAAGDEYDSITGEVTDYVSAYIEGDTAYINLVSDASINGYGFTVESVEFIP